MIKKTSPLIVTLKLDEASQSFFNGLRKEHFPKHVNFMDAHCTLFHKLPSSETSIKKILLTASNHPEINLKVNAVKNIGSGVVYTIASTELEQLHKTLQKRFSKCLIRRDRLPIRPHITIQNKVTAFKANTLHQKLNAGFQPFDIKATGLSTWLYLKGPWEHVEDLMFNNAVPL